MIPLIHHLQEQNLMLASGFEWEKSANEILTKVHGVKETLDKVNSV
jgi:hypothetical protein